jgi:benzoyl-CoA reductase subunit BamC
MTTAKKKKTKIVKTIEINVDKCNGCRACEVVCSGFHAVPRWSSTNPARSRIRVTRDPLEDIYLPVYAGEYTAAECAGCRAACPSRDYFTEPDSNLPLKCDMCSSDPTLKEPWCVQWCLADALVLVEREVEVEPEDGVEDLDYDLEAIANKHGWPQVLDAVRRMAGEPQ